MVQPMFETWRKAPKKQARRTFGRAVYPDANRGIGMVVKTFSVRDPNHTEIGVGAQAECGCRAVKDGEYERFEGCPKHCRPAFAQLEEHLDWRKQLLREAATVQEKWRRQGFARRAVDDDWKD